MRPEDAIGAEPVVVLAAVHGLGPRPSPRTECRLMILDVGKKGIVAKEGEKTEKKDYKATWQRSSDAGIIWEERQKTYRRKKITFEKNVFKILDVFRVEKNSGKLYHMLSVQKFWCFFAPMFLVSFCVNVFFYRTKLVRTSLFMPCVDSVPASDFKYSWQNHILS